uniref:Uncharacterized protein n=1 Tax=Anguilla anguilla TaxID=7936 RepID=A0A0E9PPT0_ANGAN
MLVFIPTSTAIIRCFSCFRAGVSSLI